MSQDVFSDINPSSTSGTQLATLLNSFKAALMSGLSGTSRPTELLAGGMWIDTTDELTPDFKWYLKLYDGTNDIVLFTINISTNSVSVTGSESTFQVTKISDDIVGALLTLQKERIASSGQVLDGDVVGEIIFKSTSDTGAHPIVAKIKAIASDDVTDSISGTYLTFEATDDAEGAAEEMMRLVNNKLGINITVPQGEVHAAGTLGIIHERETDDALGAKLIARKKRLAGDGSVQTSDVIGGVEYSAEDDTGSHPSTAVIEASATEGHTTTNKGTSLSVKVMKTTENTLTEKVVIGDNVQIKEEVEIDAPKMGKQDIATTATITALDTAKHLVRMTGATETNIQGILATGDSKTILIHNGSSENIILNHENVGASAADRLQLPETKDIIILPDSSVELFYSTTDTKWKLKTSAGVSVIDDDTMATASNTTVSTSESVKAYVDAEVNKVAPTIQKFLSGTGTYTTPANVLYLQIELVGAGGGGGGSGLATPGVGGTGGNTTFGTTLLQGTGGTGGGWASTVGGAGGLASLGSGPIGLAVTGGNGGGVNGSGIPTFDPGGVGGYSALGGGGSSTGSANTGAGGQGASITTVGTSGTGGGSGGYVKALITSSIAGTYSYATGSGGAGGTAGSGAGAAAGSAGGSGILVVTEFY